MCIKKYYKFFLFIMLIIMLMFFIFQIGKFIYYTFQAITLITHVDYEEGTLEEKETYDSAYNMVIELEEVSDLYYINVKIFDEKTKQEVFSIDNIYRAWDFKWITWEKGSYHFWVESGDLGTFCYEYGDNGWTKIGLTSYLEKHYGDSVNEIGIDEINKKLPNKYTIEMSLSLY